METSVVIPDLKKNDNGLDKHKRQLILIYKAYNTWLNSQINFIKFLMKKKDKELETAYHRINYTPSDYLISFLANDIKFKQRFIQIHKNFVKFILKMRLYANVKTVNKTDIKNYISLVRRKKHDFELLKGLIDEYIIIHRKLKYFISGSFISSSLFFKIPNIKYKYYYKNKKELIVNKCRNNICDRMNDEEQEKIYDDFTKAKLKVMKTNKKNKVFAIHRFVTSNIFKKFYECYYNNCNKIFLATIRSKVNYYYAIECLRNPIINNRHKNELSDLKKSLKYSNIKTFKDFLNVMAKYWRFVIALNIYI